MTVSAQTPINRSTGNGVTTVFPYTFKIIAAGDIEVSVDDVVKTLNVDYTVSGAGVDAGGNVTMAVAPASLTKVVRRRNMALTRTTDYQDQGALPAATLDNDIDAPVLMIQQLNERLDRTFSLPVSSSASSAMPAPTAGYVLGWDGTGENLTNLPGTVGSSLIDLAASGGSALVGYLPAGTGAVPATMQAKLRESVSVLDFGADPTGATDSTSAIQAAIAAASHVVVPQGTYRCDTMIELTEYKTLELKGGATLTRYSADSASTDPVVWIKGSGASLFGAGQISSNITSQNRSPTGVVRLGHASMTASHGNVNYCTLRDLGIAGAVGYGQTTGEKDIALYMANPQLGGLTSYFHNVSGLRLANANYGLWLCGWANGNTISNIQGIYIGNTTLGTDSNAFVVMSGCLDNSISSCFFTFSANSIGLLVEDYDNTGTPDGSNHTIYANSVRGFICEQGGADAIGLKSALVAGSSYYELKSNVSLGNSLPTAFYSKNVVFGLSSSILVNTIRSLTTVTADTDLIGAKSLLGGATSDGVNIQNIAGGQAIGGTSQRTYAGTGKATIVVSFGYALTGAVYRSAVVELLYNSIKSDGTNQQNARYYVPISGLSAYAIGTPVAIYGADLTITQTENAAGSVTFTVEGLGTADAIYSIFAVATGNVKARLA